MANENSKDQEQKPQVQMIPIEKIHDLPGVPISKPADKSLGGLVSSIQSIGITEPVILRQRDDGEYQLVEGYRRRRAGELAAMKEIPALVYDMTEQAAKTYYTQSKSTPDIPIPGKLIPLPEKTEPPKPKDEKAPEQPAKESKKPEDKPSTSGDKDKKAEPTASTPPAPKKPEEKKEPNKERAKAAAAPSGPAAAGPTGTAITQVFDPRLDPPDEKALKDLPIPKEGESYFITLHPGYLEKSEFNTISVDRDSENFKELQKAIELAGVKDPVLTRPKKGGGLEILSGQRRHMIAKELNYPVPAIIQQIDDDDAKILVADSNLHRDKISSYDLSRALKMKMEGMKRKAGRRKKSDPAVSTLNTDEALAKEMGMSVSKLNRMVRLSEAIKEVCDRLDNGELQLSIASSISYLKPENQLLLMDLMDVGHKPTTLYVEEMKRVEKLKKLNQKTMVEIMEGTYGQPAKAPTPTVPAPPPAAAGTPVPTEKPTAEPAPEPPVTPSEAPSVMTFDKESGTVHVGGTPDDDILKGKQERPEVTKVVLAGDRLRKYFPDVSMTPREIEESVYEALEEREQRRKKEKAKSQIKTGPTR